MNKSLRFVFAGDDSLTFDVEPLVSKALCDEEDSIDVLDKLSKLKFVHGMVDGLRVSVNLNRVKWIVVVDRH